MIVVIGCGAAKADQPHPAKELYCGALFKASWSWATSIVPEGSIYVLSSLYGLVPSNQVISPYEMRMGQPGAISVHALTDQLARISDPTVVATCGKPYRQVLSAAANVTGHRVVYPFADVKGLGYLMQALKVNQGKAPS